MYKFVCAFTVAATTAVVDVAVRKCITYHTLAHTNKVHEHLGTGRAHIPFSVARPKLNVQKNCG